MVIPYSKVGSHALLTRAPLSTGPKPGFTFDLHVLSLPPAFVLSQDQTLMFDRDTGYRIASALYLPAHKRTKPLIAADSDHKGHCP